MRRLAIATAILVTIALRTEVAHAGGWAVVTLDPVTHAPVAGQPTQIGFSIMQHGVTPYTTGKASIVVTDDTGSVERFAATPEGPPGHHVATITFARPGTYAWEVIPDWFPKQSLGTIVVEPTVAPSSTTTTTTTVRQPIALGLRIAFAVMFTIALALAVGEFATSRRRVVT